MIRLRDKPVAMKKLKIEKVEKLCLEEQNIVQSCSFTVTLEKKIAGTTPRQGDGNISQLIGKN